MNETLPSPQVAVLDSGGQYCHLIARKVRELGVYAEVLPCDVPVSAIAGRRALIISGGPASVFEEGSPQIDPQMLRSGAGVLGICYGHHLMASHLGGEVSKGDAGEYGFATLAANTSADLFKDTAGNQQIWMSHRDIVNRLPEGFEAIGTTSTCNFAAMADPLRHLYGVQFHPEVAHTEFGRQILSNFIFDICGCRRDWDPRHRVPALEAEIARIAGDRNIFFFVSGGVDSTVAYTLCLRALGKDRVSGSYVDTGLMREDETTYVRGLFEAVGAEAFLVEEAGDQFLRALEGVCDPEEKRHIIGEQFVAVQDRILRSGHFLDRDWILGQGTIYPDTIESGGTAKADRIKTHHNRVEGIQRLIQENRIIEPLTHFYKDEVRAIGRELGLPEEFLVRHPFPGPGLAIRCLCSPQESPIEKVEQGWLIPIRSVGVQGDSRTYRSVLAIDGTDLHSRAVELINSRTDINRVLGEVVTRVPIEEMRVFRSSLTAERLKLLRAADAVVRKLSEQSGFEETVWQFPVILIPLGTEAEPDSIVLRPVDSIDGMTARSVDMNPILLGEMAHEIMKITGISGVFFDLTHKPPGTIEWE